MNLLSTTAILALFASGASAAGDHEVKANSLAARRINTHMWVFGEYGVSIFTPDGSEAVKTIPPEKACKNITSDEGKSRLRCDFYDVVSDGNKYVWASVAKDVSEIDIFRIDTGDIVGSFETCDSPRDLDYHPLREEVWVHCSKYSNISQSHMDVFSSTTPSAPIPATVTLHDNTALRSFGKLEAHASLGDVAYSTVTGMDKLFKIDLAERRVLKEIDVRMGNPKLYGVYDIAYSPVNGHIYARTEVCCTCGFVGADTLECGEYGSKNITIAGEPTEGQCGKHCRGGPTDNIGVIEFDTNSDSIVGTHAFVGSAPVYAPFSSPDGKYIVLFGLDGGKKVEILKAGASGAKSEIEHTLELDFNTTNVEDYNVFDDFAYVQMNDMNYIVVASASDYKVAIVDMNTLDISYVVLKDIPYEGRRRNRQIEWAEGTKYVWVGGRQDKEAYVIDLETKELVKTITGVEPRKILSVANHRFMGMANDYGSYFTDNGVFLTESASSSENLLRSPTTSSNDGGSSDTLSIAALALSCVAIAAVLANFLVGKKPVASKQAQEQALDSNTVTAKAPSVVPSIAQPPSVA